MAVDFAPESELYRVREADREIARIMEKYNVEWVSDVACEMWLRGKEVEPKKPELKVVN